MVKSDKIQNAFKRSEMHRKGKREKEQDKLKRRMEIRKAEKGEGGAELKRQRLAKNVPITLDNSRKYDSTSYLTADPATLRAAAERAAKASRALNGLPEESEESDEEEDEDEEDEEMPEAGPSTARQQKSAVAVGAGEADDDEPADGDDAEADEEEVEEEEGETTAEPVYLPPPKIMITTSPSPCKLTYNFCDQLKSVFPGGQFFKRPRGKGFELGRLARWGIKRGFGAVIVVNEDHKQPNALTLINLPAGPTAYFRLTSVQMGDEIAGHARPSPHSPELILNNFTTLLGSSVGGLFGALFPPQPQFRGRQVVTLHNQRDFLFFRRHRYLFASPTQAKLQEIGPRFTLKLRWLKKGLPSVTAPDGRIANGGDPGEAGGQASEAEIARQEKAEEDVAMGEMGKSAPTPAPEAPVIPALDEEQEYEWKWKPKMEVSRRTFFL